jgi:urease accessory protein
MEGIYRLDHLLCAAKAPRELRTASIKLGIRFLKIIRGTLKDMAILEDLSERIKRGECAGHHSVIYGVVTNIFNIGKVEALSAYTYSTASAIVNNCAKLIPISQNDGQAILFKSQKLFQKLIGEVEGLKEDSLGVCCAGFDLRAMQHERLYTRLYIS